MITTRAFKKSTDYATLCEWWKHWQHPIVPVDELTDTGIMVYWEEKPILCGFMIMTNAKFAFVETVCANPETSWEDREDAILVLMDTLAVYAKNWGFRRLIGIPIKTRLMEKTVAAGFKLHDEKAYICLREL